MSIAPGSSFLRIIGLLALALALSACSAIKLGYSNLPELGYWWLDGYLDFEDSQDQRVREDLSRLHAWHRGNELPRLAELLQRLERLAPADVSATQVCAFVPPLRERLQAVTEKAEPSVVTLAVELAPAQLQHLERKYARNVADYRKDWLRLSPADQAEKRAKQLVERMEMIYGSLGAEQKAVLAQQLQRSTFDAQRVLAERQRRQRDTLQTLRKIAGQPVPLDEARTLMRGLLERSLNSPDADYRAYQESLIQETCATLSAVHNSTTPAQRQNAVGRLRGYQRDLGELSGTAR